MGIAIRREFPGEGISRALSAERNANVVPGDLPFVGKFVSEVVKQARHAGLPRLVIADELDEP
jgi:hypothetical protein